MPCVCAARKPLEPALQVARESLESRLSDLGAGISRSLLHTIFASDLVVADVVEIMHHDRLKLQ